MARTIMDSGNSRTCILHIGLTKTGSTTIQEFLFKHMDDERFHYAHADQPNVGQALFYAFAGDHSLADPFNVENYSEERLQSMGADIREKLLHHFRSHPNKNMIISAEGMSVLKPEAIAALMDFLKPHFSLIEVVGYVRNPKSHMESSFQQRLKNTFDSKINVRVFSPKYRFLLEKFDHFVERENVHIWPFDAKIFPEGDVVMHFCKQLGIRPPASKVTVQNQSLSRNAISLLYTHRRYMREPDTGRSGATASRLLIDKLHELKGSKLKFHPDWVVNPIMKNLDQIDWLQQRHDIDFHEDIDAMEKTGIRSKNELMTYSQEALDWLASELNEKPYQKVLPWTLPSLCTALWSIFTRKRRLATRRTIAADVCRLKAQLLSAS